MQHLEEVLLEVGRVTQSKCGSPKAMAVVKVDYVCCFFIPTIHVFLKQLPAVVVTSENIEMHAHPPQGSKLMENLGDKWPMSLAAIIMYTFDLSMLPHPSGREDNFYCRLNKVCFCPWIIMGRAADTQSCVLSLACLKAASDSQQIKFM